ncbi:MAG: class I SAM-dependent methyltransferase [Gammaproteobacteria bacterium]
MTMLFRFALSTLLVVSFCASANEIKLLTAAAEGAHRSEANIARNAWRHPVETLLFFGIKNDMRVAEVWPGSGGWYTEILAPYLKENGVLVTLNYDGSTGVEYFEKGDKKFRAKLAANPDVYGKVVVKNLMPPKSIPAISDEVEELDMLLTFRNVHNWVRNGIAEDMFKHMHALLKPGGVLGLVAHRGTPEMTEKKHANTGYLADSVIISLAERHGFELVDTSEINANPKDTKDHPEGVWTLPPSYRLGEVDREKYQAIGESDRMTFKFVKFE